MGSCRSGRGADEERTGAYTRCRSPALAGTQPVGGSSCCSINRKSSENHFYAMAIAVGPRTHPHAAAPGRLLRALARAMSVLHSVPKSPAKAQDFFNVPYGYVGCRPLLHHTKRGSSVIVPLQAASAGRSNTGTHLGAGVCAETVPTAHRQIFPGIPFGALVYCGRQAGVPRAAAACCGMATARQRLLKEYKEVARSRPDETGITLIPNESNLFCWRALLKARRCAQHAACSDAQFTRPHQCMPGCVWAVCAVPRALPAGCKG